MDAEGRPYGGVFLPPAQSYERHRYAPVYAALARARDNREELDTKFFVGLLSEKMHLLPKQGDKPPWTNTQDYALDKKIIHEDPVDDGVLQFTNPVRA